MRPVLLMLILFAAVAGALVPPAAAQVPDLPAATAEPGATGYPAAQAAGADVVAGLPARAAQARTLRAHWHVYVAFAITWLLLFGYALSLGRRFGRLDEDVRRLGGARD